MVRAAQSTPEIVDEPAAVLAVVGGCVYVVAVVAVVGGCVHVIGTVVAVVLMCLCCSQRVFAATV